MKSQKPHQHHKQGESKIQGWNHCVSTECCDGRSHGGVTYVDHCSCGATRLTESNGGKAVRGPWLID